MTKVKAWDEVVADEKIAAQQRKIADLEKELAKAKLDLLKMMNEQSKAK